MSLFTQWVPATWSDEPHRAELEQYADRVIDGYTELAPNFKQSVIHRQVIGPWEMEHEYGLIGGNIFHGELSPDQLFHMRPAPGYADFTTPIAGLYQCSSATHGGGGVTGIPALLCTRRILADERRRRLARRFRRSAPMSAAASAVAAPVDAAALAPVLDPPARRACCRPPPTSTTPCWRGSARHLFADAWVCAGRSADLAAVGARRAVAVGDDAVLLVRGDDGVLRGFFNVCQHRAHELAPCGSTSQHRSIHCPYHGWRYGLDGRCCRRRASTSRPGSTAPSTGSCPVAVEEWHGWIMVNASGTAPPVDEFLDGIEPHVADHEPERLVVGATHSYELAANWKLIVENYHECFHCPNIHPELCAVSPSTSGENYNGHAGMWVGGWQDLMPHAVTMSLSGASADGAAARPARRRPPAHRLPRPAARTCSSACTPTT